MVWGIVSLAIGAVYGYAKPGRQDKLELLKTGALAGTVLGALLAVLGWVTGFSPFGLGTGLVGAILSFLILALLFVAGVWVGDVIEHWNEDPETATT